jgi:hypothetical protein
MSSPVTGQRPSSKFAPNVALVQLDEPTIDTLTKAFAQCGVQTTPIGEDFRQRIAREQFQGCVVRLDDHAGTILEAVRTSRSNHRIILYGILPRNEGVRRFFKYGINAVLESPVDRVAALKLARSTSSLLLNELRLYIRIPLVIEVSVETPSGTLSGSSREVSGGGMSVQLTKEAPLPDKLSLSFTLPEKTPVSLAATASWRKNSLVGFQFRPDPARQKVKDWINAFLGLD